jgi:hypothetical protein
MKKAFIQNIFATLIIVSIFSACSKDSNSTNTTNNNDTANIATQGSWVAKATMPTGTSSAVNYGRTGSFSFVIDEYAYIGSGYTSQNATNTQSTDLTEFWKYNPNTNTWTQISSIPSNGRSYPYTFTINNLGFVGGGYSLQTGTTLNDLYSYDPSNNTWTDRGKNTNIVGLYKSFSFALNNYGYVGGGINADGNYQNTVYKYSLSNNSWTIVNSFPGDKKANAVSFVNNNKAYVVGGETGGGDLSYDFYSFDGTDWSELRLIRNAESSSYDDKYTNIARYKASAFTINNWAYIVGGEAGSVANTSTWSYDIANDLWYSNTAFPMNGNSNIGKLIGGTGFAINNKGYFLTGIATGTSNTYTSSSNFYEFDVN